MTKKSFLVILMAVFLLVSLSSCAKKFAPSAPYDATPTPAPPLRVEISLSDSGAPAKNVLMTIDSSSGTTNAAGYLILTVQGFGSHSLIIPNDIDHGFSNSLSYAVNVTKDWTSVNIDRGIPVLDMAIDPKSANVFSCMQNRIIYHLKYSTPQKKTLNLQVNGLPSSFQWQFAPPIVENDGDTSTLTITTPKYYQAGYYFAPVTFTAFGQIGYEKYPVGNTITGYALYQGWDFRLKDQNINNEIPMRYFIQNDYSNTCNIQLYMSINTSNSIATDSRILDHSNFPTEYPIKVKIVPGSTQVYVSSLDTWYDLNVWFPAATNSFFYVNGTSLGPLGTVYAPADVMSVLNGSVYTVFAYNAWLPTYYNYLVTISKVKFKIQFYNDDGFSTILTARSDFTY